MSTRVEAEVPTLFGAVLKQKRRAFPYTCGMEAPLAAVILDSDGNPLDLDAPFLQGAEWKARFTEAVGVAANYADGTVTRDGSTLVVSVPDSVSLTPGVYEVSVAALADGKLVTFNDYYIYNEPSPWAGANSALPPIQQVRLSLRDSDILENELLIDKQFFLTDICYATVAAIRSYNMALPNIKRLVVDTTCFPERDLLMLGIRTFLFMNMLDHYRKNTLAYQAGGISINDSKLQEYFQAYQEESKKFEQACMVFKSAQNLRAGFGWAGGFWR